MKRFKRSAQLVAIGAMPQLLNLIGGAALLGAGHMSGKWYFWALGSLALIVGLVGLWLAVAIRYELDDFELRIFHGFWKTRIPLECIEGIVPTRRYPYWPPTTVETLTVVFQRGGKPRAVMVSPTDADEFVRAVAAGAPFLEMRGDRAIKKPSLTP